MTWFGLAVCILAAYRITRVVTEDSITDAPRDRIYHWAWVEPGDGVAYQMFASRYDGEPGQPVPRAPWRTYVNELVNCPWCMGVWVSFAVTAFWAWVVRDGIAVAAYLVVAAAVAGGQGFVASRKDA